MSDFEDLESGIFGIVSDDFIPIPEQEHLGNSNLTFNGLLDEPGLLVYEDGGAAGCGGKLWPAGELLSGYMIHVANDFGNTTTAESNGSQEGKSKIRMRNVVELGSGTGLVG